MYRYKLYKNNQQIHSSNNKLSVKSWMLADKRHPGNEDAKYEIVDGLENGSFDPNRQALHG